MIVNADRPTQATEVVMYDVDLRRASGMARSGGRKINIDAAVRVSGGGRWTARCLILRYVVVVNI